MKKFMENKPLFWGVIGGVAALVILGVVLALTLGGGSNNGNQPALIGDCVITVKTEGGLALENVNVAVYTSADKTDMVAYAKTDKDGKATVTQVHEGCVAVLEGVPAGYAVEATYPITQADTQIVLKTELLKEMAPITLGGVMFDFTVTDTDGVSHTLSELLKTKKAVVLNLWFAGCGPCEMEFPYLQEAYDQYSSDLAVLALNPVTGETEDTVKTYKSEHNLTFPMAKVDDAWGTQYYPTTIVIDRFGTVGLIHVGAVDSTKTFADAFAYFTAEDYVQSKVENIKDLEIEAAPGGEGTVDNPLEFGGVTEFEVTVKPGEKVYCNVFRVSGMMMKIEDAAAVVTYGDKELKPVNGVIEALMTTEDTFTPAQLIFGNSAAEEKTFKVNFYFLPGTLDNPYTAEGDSLDVKISEGNAQGVYYIYKSAETGKMTLTCMSATSGVNYGFVLYNLNSYKMLTSEENGETVNGKKTLTIEVSKGDEVQIIVSTLPNEENVYPAAELKFALSFEKGEAPQIPDVGGDSGSQGGTQQGGSQQGGTQQGGSQNTPAVGTPSGEYEELYVGNAYFVEQGETPVGLASDIVNYFIFTPEKAGKYKVSISAGKISFWGGNTVGYIAEQTNSESILEKNSTSFTVNFMEGQVGSVILIGVEGSGTAKLTITRTGNSIEEKPFTVYAGMTKPTSQFTYTGGSLSVVDITAATTKVVQGRDGYYHWGSANGPVVYVKLNDKTDSSGYLSFEEWLNSERPVIKTAVGSGSAEKKWDFTACMEAYVKYKDKNTGYYPLNDDLMFMLQTLYKGQQWKSNIFSDISNLNEEMAWMFCCYYEK